MTDFGQYLRLLREKRGLTLQQLADNIHTDAAVLSRLETGKRGIPKPPTLKKLAEALDVSEVEMFVRAGVLSAPLEDSSNGRETSVGDWIPVFYSVDHPYFTHYNPDEYRQIRDQDRLLIDPYYVRMNEDSMVGYGIPKGALVLVERDNKYRNGKIQLLYDFEGNYPTHRFRKVHIQSNGWVCFQASSPEVALMFEPIEEDSNRVAGTAVRIEYDL